MPQIRISEVIGGGYDDFWVDKSRYRVLKGGKGSKKSATTALNLIFRLMKYPKSNLLVVRNVMGTHRDSTFAQLKWAIDKLNVSHLWKCTVSPLEITYKPTGQKILFRGFDDVLKLASTTVAVGFLNFVWVEEAYEITSDADFDKLDLSVPRGEVPEGYFKQTTLTFNPWNEHHWLKSRFFDASDDKKREYSISTYTTNYLINEFLSDTDRKVFEFMKERNYRQYEVAGLGNWGVSEGLVYENWEILEFDYKKLGIGFSNDGERIDESWKYKCFFGLDYGYVNDPTAFVAFSVNPMDKTCYIFDEHYQTGMLNTSIVDTLTAKGYGKERIRADSAEPKSNDDLRRLGLRRVENSVKGKDSVNNGIDEIRGYKIYVHPRCKAVISELSSYCFKTEKLSSKFTNTPEDRNNHAMDALRYGFWDVKYFKPRDPSVKRKKPTALEYYEKQHGISPADMKGGWI